MYKYEVGGYFFGSKMRLQEGIHLGFDDSGLYLLVCLDRMTEKEIKKLRTGKAEFALYEKDGILFLLVRIPGVLDWSDAPFHMGLYEDEREVPEIPEGAGLALTIYGIEATSGKIKSMRLIGLGTKFSRELVQVMKNQQTGPQIDRQEYNQQLEVIYGMYTCEMMVQRAIVTYRTRED
jgi:hypothetical protein